MADLFEHAELTPKASCAGRRAAWLASPLRAMPVFVTGILYMSGGAVWRDRHQFAFGVWLSFVNAFGLILGAGWHSLAVSVLGGGGMLATAAYLRLARNVR